MFDCEAAFHEHQRKCGQKEAVEYIADLNRYTTLRPPSGEGGGKSIGPSLGWMRVLFDRNEHFIEMSSMGEEDRSLALLMAILLLSPMVLAIVFFVVGLRYFGDLKFYLYSIGFFAFSISVLALFFSSSIAPTFFTYLRPRYRFNRTTRKVYVLRPKRYGGNVILDWDRVKAHVTWCAPREMTPDQIDDKFARQLRQERGGGPFGMRGLVLYWPPLGKR
ncbi:hypothetical protein WJ511_20815 [Ralstonia solanacearum]|uniref:Transmembrane protein n=1 Tax=Ralstonia solanacearum IPO1609 TaxID=564066 RepID=A0A7U7JDZ6_RALSL|nr:hypothetical protein [Ralstonia solanacearum]NUU73212.1 hypothetical protein [Ralstonia solanacearum]CEJ17116.1 hypothetical protein RSIPO_05012 [Ralstonia solanacearum IPO1609]